MVRVTAHMDELSTIVERVRPDGTLLSPSWAHRETVERIARLVAEFLCRPVPR